MVNLFELNNETETVRGAKRLLRKRKFQKDNYGKMGAKKHFIILDAIRKIVDENENYETAARTLA